MVVKTATTMHRIGRFILELLAARRRCVSTASIEQIKRFTQKAIGSSNALRTQAVIHLHTVNRSLYKSCGFQWCCDTVACESGSALTMSPQMHEWCFARYSKISTRAGCASAFASAAMWTLSALNLFFIT